MKKAGIITFHASHNFGSMLQAYALQQVISGMGIECIIINFRTLRQKQYYAVISHHGTLIKRCFRLAYFLPYLNALIRRHILFEKFLRDKYVLTSEEYSSIADLKSAGFDFDYYISGSDQIWNTHCCDFDWAYYLNFVQDGKKIAYAPSMGPKPQTDVDQSLGDRIKELVDKYDAISVREKGTAERLKAITGHMYPVLLDPTLLLPSSHWKVMAGSSPLVRGDYILVYTPGYNEHVYDSAHDLSVKTGARVIQPLARFYVELKESKKRSFDMYLAAGPIEFLNLCRYARYIVGGSFHVAVFAIMFKVPFHIVDGNKDSRIAQLLSVTGLEKCGEKDIDYTWTPDFDRAIMQLEVKRNQSLEWLKYNLDV